jgi:hypothetical protein
MKKYLIILVLIIVVLGVVIVGVFSYQKANGPIEQFLIDGPYNQGMCTKEAKICPDGSAVGRQGPVCEFAQCPVLAGIDKVGLIKQAFAEKYNKSVDGITVTIKQEEGDYVRGGVSFGSGLGEGGYFLATKVNNKWEIVADGNGEISCKLVNSYNFPSEMISDCSDL